MATRRSVVASAALAAGHAPFVEDALGFNRELTAFVEHTRSLP